ncbi:hypothetical protein NQ315_014317 [Exocentrus adspersus]|nr:hypothetical protein NQ315_014317 [Exocentrus adspersus]
MPRGKRDRKVKQGIENSGKTTTIVVFKLQAPAIQAEEERPGERQSALEEEGIDTRPEPRQGPSPSETLSETIEVRQVAGRLKHFASEWTKITNSSFILNTVTGFKIPFLSTPKNKSHCRIRDFAQLIGTLISICPAVPYGYLYTKKFERYKYLHLTRHGGNYDKVMPVPASLDQHITWWLNTLNGHPKLFFKQTDFVIEIFTDASPTGWGAFANGEKTHGFWPKSKSKEHINVLELWAAFYGLKSFANEMCNCRILLRLDNTTAISNLNRMGGVKYEHLNRITNMIWDWCENRNIMLFASYINTRDNIEADKESRSMDIETEFELNSLAFNEIVDTFGLPQIDLFASNLNTKCATYVSWHRDPDCYAGTTPVAPDPYPGCREALRRAFQLRGVPDAAIPTLRASLSKNTQKQYNSTFVKWWKWCNDRKTSQLQPSIKNLMEFLQTEFENGASYATVNTHRSALALLFSLSEEDKLLIQRFLKGVYKTKPVFPKYKYTWDPTIVLTYLENQHTKSLSLADLTLKAASLLALTSAHRIQTLTKININDIKVYENDRMDIGIFEILKTSHPTRNQPFLSFRFFTEKPELCVASTLLRYLEITKPFRGENDKQLFLTFKKPFHPASSQTISRWVKSVLKKSGIDTDTFKSHSTRHAVTSAAARGGINMDAIREAAGWTPKSDVFNRFYNRPVASKLNFAEAVLKLQSSRTPN